MTNTNAEIVIGRAEEARLDCTKCDQTIVEWISGDTLEELCAAAQAHTCPSPFATPS